MAPPAFATAVAEPLLSSLSAFKFTIFEEKKSFLVSFEASPPFNTLYTN